MARVLDHDINLILCKRKDSLGATTYALCTEGNFTDAAATADFDKGGSLRAEIAYDSTKTGAENETAAIAALKVKASIA